MTLEDWDPWSLRGLAAIVDSLGYHIPTHAAQLNFHRGTGPFDPDVFGEVWRRYDAAPERTYEIGVWIRRYSGQAGVALRVQNPVGGDWITIAEIAYPDSPPPMDWVRLAGKFVAVGPDVEVSIASRFGLASGAVLADEPCLGAPRAAGLRIIVRPQKRKKKRRPKDRRLDPRRIVRVTRKRG